MHCSKKECLLYFWIIYSKVSTEANKLFCVFSRQLAPNLHPVSYGHVFSKSLLITHGVGSVNFKTKLPSHNFSQKMNKTLCAFCSFFGRGYGSTILFWDLLTFNATYNIHIWDDTDLKFWKFESLWNKTLFFKYQFCLFH